MKISVLGALALALLSSFAIGANVTLSSTPTAGDACAGPTVTFPVVLSSNTTAVGGYEVNVVYDNTRLSAPAFGAATFPGSPTSGIPSVAGNLTTITVNAFNGSSTFTTGNLFLVTFTLIGSSTGDYEVDVTATASDTVIDTLGAPISSSVQPTPTLDCNASVNDWAMYN